MSGYKPENLIGWAEWYADVNESSPPPTIYGPDPSHQNLLRAHASALKAGVKLRSHAEAMFTAIERWHKFRDNKSEALMTKALNDYLSEYKNGGSLQEH